MADNVRAELARRRVRQADVAKWLGISRTAAHRRLTGQVVFDVEQIQQIASRLGVPLDQLVEPPAAEVAS